MSQFVSNRSACTLWLFRDYECPKRNVCFKKESCAIAKMSARCALSMSALKVLETPDLGES